MRLLTDIGVRIAMRDGTELVADVYRPDMTEPVPVLVMRTPYGRGSALANAFFEGLRFVREGYALVVQDTRGRFDSGGTFYPFRDEAKDGVDTIGWAAGQPWSSGKVGMIGASYVGTTQWLTAAENPVGLQAIAPIVTAADYRDGWVYRGGAFELGFSLQWTLALCVDTAERRVADGSGPADLVERVRDAQDRIETLYGGLDADAEDLARDLAPYYLDWRAHPERDAEWPSIAPDLRPEAAMAPALDVGGWHDIFLAGTLANFRRQRDSAIAADRPGPRLIVGPWTHGVYTGTFQGRRFGVRSSMDVLGLASEQLRWFDRWLRSRSNGVEDGPAVRLFVMGSDVWRDFADWPPPGVTETSYHLGAASRPETERATGGDRVGRLTLHPPAGDDDHDVLPFERDDPVPTLGGATLMAGSLLGERAGPADLARILARTDVLVYESAPLERPVTIIGPVRLRIHATSALASFDIVGHLADIGPDGHAELLTGGILRVVPDRSDEERIVDLGATAAVIPEGHRVGLVLAASDFPRFDLNPASAAAGSSSTEIHHSALRPSRLILPLLEG